MPRPALTEDQRRVTRRRIQKAAANLYAKNGFKDISARKVAEEAGVSVGSLYSYFENLTELMQSLWKEPLRRLLKELETSLPEIADPLVRLRALLEAYVAFANDQRSTYRGAFLFVRPDTHDKPEQAALTDDRLFSMLRDTIAAAQAEGLARDGDPDLLAQLIWSGIHGAIALPQNIDRLALAKPEQAAPPMIDALLEWLQQ